MHEHGPLSGKACFPRTALLFYLLLKVKYETFKRDIHLGCMTERLDVPSLTCRIWGQQVGNMYLARKAVGNLHSHHGVQTQQSHVGKVLKRQFLICPKMRMNTSQCLEPAASPPEPADIRYGY